MERERDRDRACCKGEWHKEKRRAAGTDRPFTRIQRQPTKAKRQRRHLPNRNACWGARGSTAGGREAIVSERKGERERERARQRERERERETREEVEGESESGPCVIWRPYRKS